MFQYVRVTRTTVSTYCRICEPLCGMIATVEDGRLVSLRPDDEHPLSRGYACPKGLAFPEVQHDPDRVLHPLRSHLRIARAQVESLLREAEAEPDAAGLTFCVLLGFTFLFRVKEARSFPARRRGDHRRRRG